MLSHFSSRQTSSILVKLRLHEHGNIALHLLVNGSFHHAAIKLYLHVWAELMAAFSQPLLTADMNDEIVVRFFRSAADQLGHAFFYSANLLLHKEGGASVSALPGFEKFNTIGSRKEVAQSVQEAKQAEMIAAK